MNRVRIAVVAFILLAALGFLLFQGLGDATTYFRTADEAVAEREELGTRRFRLEGVVEAGTVRRSGDSTLFSVSENGATVRVRHTGDPPQLFKPNIPVVLEGRFDGDVFASDRIMVKHTSEYKAKYPERVEPDSVR